MAGATFLLLALVNGYGKIERRLSAIEERLTRTERGLGLEPAVLSDH